jgi:taurine--2-oxoglutarate transaminase
VFIQPWISHLVIAPPLIITREEVEAGIDALDAALVIADREADA